MKKIVGLSGGKDCTAMALRLMEAEPDDYTFAITPTGRELPPVLEHWKRLESLLGKPLMKIPAPTLVQLIVKHKTLPNWRMRFCTRQVKIEPFMAYVKSVAPAIVPVKAQIGAALKVLNKTSRLCVGVGA